MYLRCPHCTNVVGQYHGDLLECRMAIRGRNRRSYVLQATGLLRVSCDRCGRAFAPAQRESAPPAPPSPVAPAVSAVMAAA